MNEYMLPVTLKNQNSCEGCRVLDSETRAFNHFCGVNDSGIVGNIENLERPANCPLKPFSKQFGIRTMQLIPDESCPKDQFKLIGNNMALLVNFTNELTTEKPKQNCRTCKHNKNSEYEMPCCLCPILTGNKSRWEPKDE